MIRVHLLGSVEVRDAAGRPLPGLVLQPKRAALLAYLATAAEQAHSRDTLLALFWPELDTARARRALNQAVHQLREQLGEDVIRTEGRDRLLFATDVATCDVIEFERAVSEGRATAALACYRGDLLAGFHVSELPELERWIDEARVRLRLAAAKTSWLAADQALARGDRDEAQRLGKSAQSLSSEFDESALRRLMLLLDRCGERSQALQEYERFAARLTEDLGAAPDAESRALVARLRVGSLVPASADLSTAEQPSVVSVDADVADAAPRRPRSTLKLAVILAASVAVGIVGWQNLRPRAAQAGGVAVFPLSYSGSPELAHLSNALADLVAASIADVEGLHSVDTRAVATAAGGSAPSRRTAQRVARELGASTVITGTVSGSGGRLRVALTLSDVGVLGPPNSAVAEGTPEDLFTLADRVATQLVAQRTGSGVGARAGSATRLTSSPSALRAWTEGETAYRTGRFTAAVSSFRAAVEADSTFALAWLRLSNAAHWTGEGVLAERAAGRAEAYGARLSARTREHVAAWSLFIKGRADEAEPRYRALLAQDSADVEAWVQLGELGFHWGPSVGRPASASRESWERALRLAPYHVPSLVHLARVEAHEGNRAAFDNIVSRVRALEPGSETTQDLAAVRAFAFGSAAERTAAAASIAEVAEATRRDLIQHAVWSAQDPMEARRLLAPLLHQASQFSNRQAGDYAYAAGLELAGGRLGAARITLDSGTTLEPNRMWDFRASIAARGLLRGSAVVSAARVGVADAPSGRGAEHPRAAVWRLFSRGVLAARTGDSAVAMQSELTLIRVGASTDGSAELARFYGRLLGAERLAASGNHEAALDRLGPVTSAPVGLPGIWSYSRAHARFLRGELLAALGREDEALRWFETFPDPNGYDFAFLPAALVRQWQLHRALGHNAEADEVRAKLKRLLGGADAGVQTQMEALAASLGPFGGPNPRSR